MPSKKQSDAVERVLTRFSQHSIIPLLHHSTIPPLQHSNIPTLQHSNIPTFHHSNIPTLQHSITPLLHHHSITPTLRFLCSPNSPPLKRAWASATSICNTTPSSPTRSKPSPPASI